MLRPSWWTIKISKLIDENQKQKVFWDRVDPQPAVLWLHSVCIVLANKVPGSDKGVDEAPRGQMTCAP